MKTNLLSAFLFFISFFIYSLPSYAQQLLPCAADSIRLTRLEIQDGAFVRLHLGTSGLSGEVIFQEVMHTFAVGTELFVETKPTENGAVDFFLQSLTGAHEFKVVNTCVGESAQHTGASLFVTFNFEEDINCPPITDLIVNQFTNDFIAFSWADTSIHIEYQVDYQPGATPVQTTPSVPSPMFEQELANTIVHTFTIIAFCDDPAPQRDIVQSPAFSFSVVTIDDIKLLPGQVDTVRQAIPFAFRLHAPCSPFQNTVNKDDFLNNLDSYILNPDSCMMISNTAGVQDYLKQLQVFPNPVKDELWVSYRLPGSQNVRLDLLTMDGQSVGKSFSEKSQAAGLNKIRLNLVNLPQGMYLLKMQGENFRQYTKVLLMP